MMGGKGGRLRAVFDCMVFLQGAARERCASGICLQLVDSGVIDLCVSDEIIAEIRDVFKRPRVRRKFSALTGDFIDQFWQRCLIARRRFAGYPAASCTSGIRRTNRTSISP